MGQQIHPFHLRHPPRITQKQVLVQNRKKPLPSGFFLQTHRNHEKTTHHAQIKARHPSERQQLGHPAAKTLPEKHHQHECRP